MCSSDLLLFERFVCVFNVGEHVVFGYGIVFNGKGNSRTGEDGELMRLLENTTLPLIKSRFLPSAVRDLLDLNFSSAHRVSSLEEVQVYCSYTRPNLGRHCVQSRFVVRLSPEDPKALK